MSDAPRPTEDRRLHPRSGILASAVVFSIDRMHGTYLVRDLSAGGMCLVGGLSVEPGTPLRVLLQLPGRKDLPVTARVVRHEGRGSARPNTAVAFVDLSAEEEDTIHEAIVDALERDDARRTATILVVDRYERSRNTLEHDLRALGHEAVGVATPLEAVGWLERTDSQIATVLVDLSPDAGQGLDVLDFVAAHHPHIRRVVMVDERRPFRLDLALLSGRAHEALRKPCDRTDLEKTVGRAELAPQVTAEQS